MRTLAIFKRIMLQRRGDPRTLAMMFLAPIFILTLMYFLFQVPSNTAYRVGLKSDNTELTRALKDMPNDKAHLKVISVSENNRSTMNEKDLREIAETKMPDLNADLHRKSVHQPYHPTPNMQNAHRKKVAELIPSTIYHASSGRSRPEYKDIASMAALKSTSCWAFALFNSI